MSQPEQKSQPRPTIKAVRGTRDLLPDQTPLWNHVEFTARAVFARYGFGEIRTPLFEDTSLFSRSVGEETDIVSKEMFTWEDRARAASEKAQQLTLRPENTAGVVRAYIEHKLGETGQLQKLYYIGPQFRRERPQRGRYRQFWQIGAEVIGPQSSGAESPLRDAEVLEMLASLLNELGIGDWKLELNSVGSSDDRVRYNAALREALQPIKHQLCPDNQRRADTNPLRVLDSKDEADQDLINALPKIADFLSEDSREHFAQVLAALDACQVAYTINQRLVRGLDYYTRTTFEFTVITGLGTQNALLGGGRYDGLSEMLGGPRAPGIGFAIGEDRLILTLQAQHEADSQAEAHAKAQTTAASSENCHPESERSDTKDLLPSGSSTRSAWAPQKLDAYIAPLGPAQNPAALALARDLRASGLTVEVGDGSFKLRKSFDTADTLARHIILLGEDEATTNILTVKNFSTGEQNKVPRTKLNQTLRLGFTTPPATAPVDTDFDRTPGFSPAARILARLMSDLSEEHSCAGWLTGLEYILWTAAFSDQPQEYWRLSQGEIAELHFAHEQAGGWVIWAEEERSQKFVTTDEWLTLVAEEKARDGS